MPQPRVSTLIKHRPLHLPEERLSAVTLFGEKHSSLCQPCVTTTHPSYRLRYLCICMNISCIGMSTSVAGDVGTCNLIVLEGGFSDRSDSTSQGMWRFQPLWWEGPTLQQGGAVEPKFFRQTLLKFLWTFFTSFNAGKMNNKTTNPAVATLDVSGGGGGCNFWQEYFTHVGASPMWTHWFHKCARPINSS